MDLDTLNCVLETFPELSAEWVLRVVGKPEKDNDEIDSAIKESENVIRNSKANTVSQVALKSMINEVISSDVIKTILDNTIEQKKVLTTLVDTINPKNAFTDNILHNYEELVKAKNIIIARQQTEIGLRKKQLGQSIINYEG